MKETSTWVKCDYCGLVVPVGELKSIQLKSYEDMGRIGQGITWGSSLQACDGCRKYLHGSFRYA